MKSITYKISQLSILAFILQFVLSTELHAQTEDDYFLLKQANKAYTEGEFQKAVEIYEKLVNTGYVAGELYYNLGNAYYRVRDYKSAILNYERAMLIMPDNENILINLEYSQRYIQDKIETVPKFFLVSWVEGFVNMFSVKAWSVISIFGFIAFLTAVILFLFTKTVLIRKLSFYIGILTISISRSFAFQTLTVNFKYSA